MFLHVPNVLVSNMGRKMPSVMTGGIEKGALEGRVAADKTAAVAV